MSPASRGFHTASTHSSNEPPINRATDDDRGLKEKSTALNAALAGLSSMIVAYSCMPRSWRKARRAQHRTPLTSPPGRGHRLRHNPPTIHRKSALTRRGTLWTLDSLVELSCTHFIINETGTGEFDE